jgi:1-acyl-sn-glycerol-3-phosphate acyltransferase
MPTLTPTPPKPIDDVFRPDLVKLPELTPQRVKFRAFGQKLCAFLIRFLTRAEAFGLENFPAEGPAVIVANHLGDTDAVLALAKLPQAVDGIGRIELHNYPVAGWLLRKYGVIWVHRGSPDRRALKAAIDGLKSRRFIGIAPEGRQSVTGALEEGTGGAAYLALKADVPVIPLTFVGTENENVYNNWRRLRRGRVSLTVGKPFTLAHLGSLKESIQAGTELIMRKLSEQLPEDYRGVYQKS